MRAERAVFIDVPEVAERLGVSVATAYEYIHAGVIPAKRLSEKGRILIHRADFERWEREGSLANGKEEEAKKQIDLALLLDALFSGEIELVVRVRKVAAPCRNHGAAQDSQR